MTGCLGFVRECFLSFSKAFSGSTSCFIRSAIHTNPGELTATSLPGGYLDLEDDATELMGVYYPPIRKDTISVGGYVLHARSLEKSCRTLSCRTLEKIFQNHYQDLMQWNWTTIVAL